MRSPCTFHLLIWSQSICSVCRYGMLGMASHTVALDSEAYAALRALKRSEESFSDVVKRLARPRTSILDLAGAWRGLPVDERTEMEEHFRRAKEAGRRRSARLSKAWRKH